MAFADIGSALASWVPPYYFLRPVNFIQGGPGRSQGCFISVRETTRREALASASRRVASGQLFARPDFPHREPPFRRYQAHGHAHPRLQVRQPGLVTLEDDANVLG